MAESIYNVLESRSTETSVPKVEDKNGKEIRPSFGSVKHTITEEIFPTVKQFETDGELETFFRGLGILHEALQETVTSKLIKVRAAFKAMPTKAELEAGIEWSAEYGQKNVDKVNFSFHKRPSSGDKESVKKQATYDASMAVARAMKATKGISAKMLLDTLTASCGAEMAKEIINSLE